MWLQRVTGYLLKNRWQALAITFITAFIPVVGQALGVTFIVAVFFWAVGFISILIAALMTLLKGMIEGAIFLVAATFPYLMVFYFADSHESALSVMVWVDVGIVVLSNVLTWLFAGMLHQRSSWSDILQVAALIGVLAICLVHFAFPDIANWWGEFLKYHLAHVQTVAGSAKNTATELSALQHEFINESKWQATGIMVSAILLIAMLQLILTRWWQAAVFQPGSLGKELRGIRLSRLAASLFIVSIAVWYVGNSVIYDILPVMFLLFAAAGLSMVHYLFGFMQSPTAWFWLVLFYVILSLGMPVSVRMVAVFGLLDVWFDFRKRIVTL